MRHEGTLARADSGACRHTSMRHDGTIAFQVIEIAQNRDDQVSSVSYRPTVIVAEPGRRDLPRDPASGMVSYAHAAHPGGARVNHARAVVRPERVDAGLGVHDLARFEIDDGDRATERSIARSIALLGGICEVATIESY